MTRDWKRNETLDGDATVHTETDLKRDANREPIGIRCVVFDAVGTLIHADPPVDVAYQLVGARFGSKCTREQISHRFKAAYQSMETSDVGEQRLVTSEQIERDRWKKIVASVLDDVTDSDACWASLWDHFGSPDAWRCFEDVQPVLERLRKGNVELAIASNFDSRLNSVCDGHPELSSITNRVISSVVGFRKPSGHFFEAVLNQTRRRPQDILFVGDDFLNDVVGPRKSGMHAFHLQRSGAESRELETAIAGVIPLCNDVS